MDNISIHALCEEGDASSFSRFPGWAIFLSTPSARRATALALDGREILHISIHALREEGDRRSGPNVPSWSYFYPRPPRGGRHS